ncbi:MAG: hypothetical protein IJX24_06955 [Oscillospiraceae bacterium]|nr:hypothetical protein [Oscillospiraceae bacterium]
MKKKFLAKAIATAVAAACSVNALVVSNFVGADEADVYEFESGILSVPGNAYIGTDREGNPINASGDGLVFLENGGETATVEVTVEETTMYNLTASVYTPYGSKPQNILINGVDQGVIAFAENPDGIMDVDLGMYKLDAGVNTVTIKASWGWMYLDCLKVSKAPDSAFPSLDAPKELSDKNATDETKRLMCYLRDVYGNGILSGQQEIYMYGHGGNFEYEFDYIQDLTGELPAIRGFDFLNCANILYGQEDGTVDRMIDWAGTRGGIVTASWHLCVPKNFANYTRGSYVSYEQSTYKPDETDFDPSKILEEGSDEYYFYMDSIEAVATQIKKLQDAGIPLIFRPLHEAEGSGGETGSWFWWGKSGSDVYKKLWVLMYETLTEEYDLHNIIWEWNSYPYDTSENWYPGDEYVDLIGYDKYNCTNWSSGSPVLEHNVSAISSTFYKIVEKYNSKKMVAMAENDSIPTLENILGEKAAWLYFCPWYDGGSADTNFVSDPMFNTKEDLTEMYQSEYCITLDEVPENLYSSYSLEGFIEGDTEPTETTEPTEDPTDATEATDPSEDPTDATEATDPSEDPTDATEATDPSEDPTNATEATDPSEDPTDATDETIPSYTGDMEDLLYGDVDLNGVIELADVAKLAKYTVAPTLYPLGDGTPDGEAKAWMQANVSYDDVVDAADTLKLIEYKVKSVTTLGPDK